LKNEKNNKGKVITAIGGAGAGLTIVPRKVLGGKGYKAPSDTLNIACVGIDGKGRSDIEQCATENIAVLCDVDLMAARDLREEYPEAKQYQDFRVMLDNEKYIDAVTVSTPDHTHAVIAMAAMQLGKHVFVQKPLSKTVYEARKLREAAKEYNVVTQMGNQGHASEEARLINEWIWEGAIGDVTDVHAWTNRPIWPQGNIKYYDTIPSLPPTLNWDVWLGPAKKINYHPHYAPFYWRGWSEFGTGALGDMGAHLIDHAFWALDLDAPKTVQASSTAFSKDSFPEASIVKWTFPRKNGDPDLNFYWYDGGIIPERPADLEPERLIGSQSGGVIIKGTDGNLMHSNTGANPRLIPETFMQDYGLPEKTIPRSPGIQQEWIEAIKNGTKSTTDFEYSSKLTEMMLLGNIAILMKDENKILEWDSKKFRFTNLDKANDFLHYEYRPGWSID
jgi:predicted dehydrogenase